jgi:hypothetical protein
VLTYDAGRNVTTFAGDVDGDSVADFLLLLDGFVSPQPGFLL